MLSFNDPVTREIYTFNKNLLFDRRNPDSCSVGVTFYATHQNTDYDIVNQLYNLYFEIGSQSIT